MNEKAQALPGWGQVHIENSSNFGVRDHYSYVLGGMHPDDVITESAQQR